MKSKELEEEIIGIISSRYTHLNKEDITEESLILEDLDLDDLDFLYLLVEIEAHFNISISDDDWYKAVRVKDIFKLLKNKIN